MKKAFSKDFQEGNSMRAEYNFKGGVRGKHHHAMQAGYTITIHKADGTRITKEVRPRGGAVVLEPDVRQYFPDSESANTTLRSLIRLIGKKHVKGIKKAKVLNTRR